MTQTNDAPKLMPSGLSRSVISTYGEDIAKSLGYRTGDPVEILISDLGGKLSYSPKVFTGTGDAESIIVRAEDDFDVVLGTMASPGRDRFTMCHELGHLFVHYPLFRERHPLAVMTAQRWVDDADPDQRRAEWEANWFSSAFLMPEEEFRKAAETVADLGLARRFGVSLSCVQTRKKILGMAV